MHISRMSMHLVRFLDTVDAEEAVADYLSRLRGPIKNRDRMSNDGTVND